MSMKLWNRMKAFLCKSGRTLSEPELNKRLDEIRKNMDTAIAEMERDIRVEMPTDTIMVKFRELNETGEGGAVIGCLLYDIQNENGEHDTAIKDMVEIVERESDKSLQHYYDFYHSNKIPMPCILESVKGGRKLWDKLIKTKLFTPVAHVGLK